MRGLYQNKSRHGRGGIVGLASLLLLSLVTGCLLTGCVSPFHFHMYAQHTHYGCSSEKGEPEEVILEIDND